MLTVLLLLLLCLALAVVVLGLVAIPARRSGRSVLTDRGEAVFVRIRTGAGQASARASEEIGHAAAGVSRVLPKERRH